MRIVASAGVNAPAVRRMDNTNRKSRGKMAQTTRKQNSFPYMKNGIVWPNTHVIQILGAERVYHETKQFKEW